MIAADRTGATGNPWTLEERHPLELAPDAEGKASRSFAAPQFNCAGRSHTGFDPQNVQESQEESPAR